MVPVMVPVKSAGGDGVGVLARVGLRFLGFANRTSQRWSGRRIRAALCFLLEWFYPRLEQEQEGSLTRFAGHLR